MVLRNMSLNKDLSDLTDRIACWASKERWIAAVYMFGSRVKGTAHEDSDLDIAVRLNLSDEGEALGWFMGEEKRWEQELNSLVPYKVHLELYHAVATNNVVSYVSDHGIMIWERK